MNHGASASTRPKPIQASPAFVDSLHSTYIPRGSIQLQSINHPFSSLYKQLAVTKQRVSYLVNTGHFSEKTSVPPARSHLQIWESCTRTPHCCSSAASSRMTRLLLGASLRSRLADVLHTMLVNSTAMNYYIVQVARLSACLGPCVAYATGSQTDHITQYCSFEKPSSLPQSIGSKPRPRLPSPSRRGPPTDANNEERSSITSR